jgi:hypothetical protein
VTPQSPISHLLSKSLSLLFVILVSWEPLEKVKAQYWLPNMSLNQQTTSELFCLLATILLTSQKLSSSVVWGNFFYYTAQKKVHFILWLTYILNHNKMSLNKTWSYKYVLWINIFCFVLIFRHIS